jgi:hypothetical protein
LSRGTRSASTVVDPPQEPPDDGRCADTSSACHDGASTTVMRPASTMVDLPLLASQ